MFFNKEFNMEDLLVAKIVMVSREVINAKGDEKIIANPIKYVCIKKLKKSEKTLDI